MIAAVFGVRATLRFGKYPSGGIDFKRRGLVNSRLIFKESVVIESLLNLDTFQM
jgi:hypothetical protein